MREATAVATAFQDATFGAMPLHNTAAVKALVATGVDPSYDPSYDSESEPERRVRQRTDWYAVLFAML